MNQFRARKYSAGSNPVAMNTNCASGMTGWILALATLLILSLFDNGFAGKLKYGTGMSELPALQPGKMWSKVDYDPKLSDPFFKSHEWSYPYWIIKHPDGHFESTRSEDESPVKDPPRLRHTAKCFSTAVMKEEHLIRFCKARLIAVNTIDLFIQENNPAFVETLRVQIRNGEFKCEHSAATGIPSRKKLMCPTKRQELTLDKKLYRKGEVIKGRVYFECEMTDPKYVEKYSRNPKSIKVYGVFKTILE